MSPVNSGFVAEASGKIAMSCGTPESWLSNVSVVALFAGRVIVCVSKASPDAVTVVVTPPAGGALDVGGADVGGGPLLDGGPRGGGPPAPAPAGGGRRPAARWRPPRRRPPATAARRRHGDGPRHVGVDVTPEEIRAGLE